MARLDDLEGLPYAYRPLDPETQRIHFRRRRVLRMFFVFLIFCGIAVFAYFKWNVPNGKGSSEGASFSTMLQSWWQGKVPTKLDDFTDRVTENLKRETMRDDRRKSAPFVELPIEKGPQKTGVGSKSREVKKKDNSWYSTINAVMPVSLLIVLAQAGLEQAGTFFIDYVVPMLDSLVPRAQVVQLENTFRALSKKEISIESALFKSLLPVATTSGIALLTLFPELGSEIFDSIESLVKSITVWVESADPTLLLKYFTDTLAEGIVFALGLSAAMVSQTSEKLQYFVYDLFRGNELAHDPFAWLAAAQNFPKIPSWFPTWDNTKDDLFELAKGIGALKAQETLAATISSSINSYMHGGDSSKGSGSSASNPLASIATNMLTQMMSSSGGSSNDKGKDENPLASMASSLLSSVMSNNKSGQNANGDSNPLEHIMDSLFHTSKDNSGKKKQGTRNNLAGSSQDD